MFAVIYRFYLQLHQEELYKKCWNQVADYFIQHCGALGSCFHKFENNLWVAYSRWPDKVRRDAAWPGEKVPNKNFPEDVIKAIKTMQEVKQENQELPQYDEIAMELVCDKF